MTKPPVQPSVLDQAEAAKRVWEIMVWLADAGIVIVGLVQSTGGPLNFLIEVALYGFACYISLFLVLPIAMVALAALEKVANRQTTDVAIGVTAAVAMLAGGAFIRTLFYPGLADDLDEIGTMFAALVGVAILASPLIWLWYTNGSRPAAAGKM